MRWIQATRGCQYEQTEHIASRCPIDGSAVYPGGSVNRQRGERERCGDAKGEPSRAGGA